MNRLATVGALLALGCGGNDTNAALGDLSALLEGVGGETPQTMLATIASSSCKWNQNTITYRIASTPSGVDVAEAEAAVERAIGSWFGVVPLTAAPAKPNDTPDIQFHWVSDEKDPLYRRQPAYAHMPPGCLPRHSNLPRVAVFMDTKDTRWVIASGNDPDPLAKPYLDVETVVLHEIGHMLGLGHCENQFGRDVECRTPQSVMHSSSYYGSAFRSQRRALYPVDLGRVQGIYPTP